MLFTDWLCKAENISDDFNSSDSERLSLPITISSKVIAGSLCPVQFIIPHADFVVILYVDALD
ncbi:MAG: hypothetical protein A2X11_12445 [Bacteroidetes bacterium GWE2_42_24]|nr:MAG: hypothetical protein A2X11_12445 [Bacteroidetes bacterium GWE2_42_24]OFY30587.1 MAG: hypothetical protein A2X09_03690 [Bacteroidetes bacterium GWF2_43_11]